MPDLRKLARQRKHIERRIREKERDILEPYVRRKCLSTTFPINPEGTVKTLSDDEIPGDNSVDELCQIIKQDKEWQSLKKDLEEIQGEYMAYLDDRDLTSATYKSQIKAIKKEYGYELSSYDIAKFVGCSIDYAQKFIVSLDDKTVREQRPTESLVNDELRRKVIERDSACVRCESDSNLEVHHIIPVSRGGESTTENLAVLCPNCHLKAHGGSWNGDIRYETCEGFWSWSKGPDSS